MSRPNDDAMRDRLFRRGQFKVLVGTMVGYTLFYFLRKNFSFAMPGLAQDYGITKTSLGLFLTLHGVIYGLAKFANGYFGDKARPRQFLMTGLVACLALNVALGFAPLFATTASALVTVFGVLWVLDGYFQSMGFPPCAKLMAYWIPPKELATKQSVWNTSHSIGAGLVTILCGYIMGLGTLGAQGVGIGMWRWCFWGPSILAAVGIVAVWFYLPGLPEDEGLENLKETEVAKDVVGAETGADDGLTVGKMVFRNPVIWMLGFCNFAINLVRFAILDWGPMLLKESKGLTLDKAGWVVALFEIAGIAGMILAGRATDRLAGGRGPRVCLVMMAGAAVSMAAFWFMPGSWGVWPLMGVLMLAGFFIYGPQALTGVTATNIATKRFTGTAVGFISLFSYVSVIFTGVGMGALADRFGGWSVPFACVIGVAVAGALLFAFLWNTRADSYGSSEVV